MADVMYDAKVFCRGKDISKYFSSFPQLSIEDPELQILAKEHDRVLPLGQDISYNSVYYFWIYEEYLRGRMKRGLELEGRFRNYMQDSEERLFDLFSKTKSHYTNGRWVCDRYLQVPENQFLREPVEFESESAYLSKFINAINALSKFIIIWRHDDVRRLSQPDRRTKYLFDVLNAANDCQKQYRDMEWAAAKCLRANDREEAMRQMVQYDRKEVLPFANTSFILSHLIIRLIPLLESFIQFQSEHSNEYVALLKRPLKNAQKDQSIISNYWKYKTLHPKLEEHFHRFCCEHNDRYADWAITSKENIEKFEVEVGHFLSDFINQKLTSIKLSYDLSEGGLVFETDQIYDALYALMLVELQKGKLYATCDICHKVFPIDDAYARSYCPACKNSPSKIRKYQRFKKSVTAAMNLEKVQT